MRLPTLLRNVTSDVNDSYAWYTPGAALATASNWQS